MHFQVHNIGGGDASISFNLNDYPGFTSTDALGKAKSYGRRKGALKSRLLTYEEIMSINSSAGSDTKTKIQKMLWGTDSTEGYLSYWLGTADDPIEKNWVWHMYGNGGHLSTNSCDSRTAGVRPVITVLKSSIE